MLYSIIKPNKRIMFQFHYTFFGNNNSFNAMYISTIFHLYCLKQFNFEMCNIKIPSKLYYFIFRSIIDNELQCSVKCDSVVVTTKPASQTNISTRQVHVKSTHHRSSERLMLFLFLCVCNVQSRRNYQYVYETLYLY